MYFGEKIVGVKLVDFGVVAVSICVLCAWPLIYIDIRCHQFFIDIDELTIDLEELAPPRPLARLPSVSPSTSRVVVSKDKADTLEKKKPSKSKVQVVNLWKKTSLIRAGSCVPCHQRTWLVLWCCCHLTVAMGGHRCEQLLAHNCV